MFSYQQHPQDSTSPRSRVTSNGIILNLLIPKSKYRTGFGVQIYLYNVKAVKKTHVQLICKLSVYICKQFIYYTKQMIWELIYTSMYIYIYICICQCNMLIIQTRFQFICKLYSCKLVAETMFSN